QGLHHIGPILMEFGSEAQKAQHLPPIIAGTVIWAQGYSEPGAGSDLASVSTRAIRNGDHFVVRGHKIWTTWAHHSHWMYALVRTDPAVQPRQAGISFLLIDLASAGIRIRPIKTIAGDEEFSEVFLDDVSVPAENLVGKLNDGWRIANALLGHERLGTSNPQFVLIALDRIKTMARASGIMADPAFQDRLAAASIDATALAALFNHAVELTNNAHSLGPGPAGGLGLGLTELALVCEQAGQGLVCEPIGLAAISAAALGEGNVPRPMLERVMSGDALVVPALQEGAHGDDPLAPRTQAAGEGGALRLTGQKMFVCADGVDGFLVSASGRNG